MKKYLEFIIILFGILLATYLVVMSFLAIFNLLSGFDPNAESILFLVTCILGLFGYAGLVRLLFKSTSTKGKRTRLFLIFGILSFVLFNSLMGQVCTMIIG